VKNRLQTLLWFQPLSLKCDLLVSSLCFFKFDLHRYTQALAFFWVANFFLSILSAMSQNGQNNNDRRDDDDMPPPRM
jgi:hypothetical protein